MFGRPPFGALRLLSQKAVGFHMACRGSILTSWITADLIPAEVRKMFARSRWKTARPVMQPSRRPYTVSWGAGSDGRTEYNQTQYFFLGFFWWKQQMVKVEVSLGTLSNTHVMLRTTRLRSRRDKSFLCHLCFCWGVKSYHVSCIQWNSLERWP